MSTDRDVSLSLYTGIVLYLSEIHYEHSFNSVSQEILLILII